MGLSAIGVICIFTCISSIVAYQTMAHSSPERMLAESSRFLQKRRQSSKDIHEFLSKAGLLFETIAGNKLNSRIVTSWRDAVADHPQMSFGCQTDLSFWLNATVKVLDAIASNSSKDVTDCEFALEQFDSFGKIPAGILEGNYWWYGSFGQCLDIDFVRGDDSNLRYQGQYCHAYIDINMRNPSIFGRRKKRFISQPENTCAGAVGEYPIWGMCLPSSCSDADVSMFLILANAQSNTSDVGIPVCGIDCFDRQPPIDNWGKIVSGLLIFFLLLAISASTVDYCIPTKHVLRQQLAVQLLLAFSIYSNGREIFDASTRPGQINCVHCIRVCSMLWVINSHSFLIYQYADNPLETMKFPRQFLNQIIVNGYFSVDSFFFLSGLLLAYLWFKEINKNKKMLTSAYTWSMFYVHRFIRLTPPYMIMVGLYATLLGQFVKGPLAIINERNMDDCRQNWWINLLYVNNIVDRTQECYGIAWYLAADMQIHVFAPIVLIPLALSPLAGYMAAVLLFSASVAATFVTFYKYNFVAAFVVTEPIDPKMDTDKFFLYYYEAAWVRFTPYLIGVIVGFLLQKYNRNARIKINAVTAVVGWVVCLGVMIACVFGLYDYARGHDIPIFWRAFYASFSRPGWALALAWIVFACFNGYGGPIGDFLSWNIWIPLGKLTYCAYLVHRLVWVIVMSSSQRPLHYAGVFDTVAHMTIPIAVISYSLAFFWSSVFEISSQKLEKLILGRLLGKNTRGAPVEKEKEKEGEMKVDLGKQDDAKKPNKAENGAKKPGKAENGANVIYPTLSVISESVDQLPQTVKQRF